MQEAKSAAQAWRILRENRDKVLAALKQGTFVAIHLSNWGFLDRFAAFLDALGFYKSFEAFGDLRERVSIPAFFFLMVMTYKTLLGYDSFNILPQTLFASIAILYLMGFNALQIRNGFNQKGKTHPFDPEALSEFLQGHTQRHYLRWYTNLVLL